MRLFITGLFVLLSFCVSAQKTDMSLWKIPIRDLKYTYVFKRPIQNLKFAQYLHPSPSPSPPPLPPPPPYLSPPPSPFTSPTPFYMSQGSPSLYFDPYPSIFCKLESKLESKSKLLPRFRLGSLDYTEWMEGKRLWLQ